MSDQLSYIKKYVWLPYGERMIQIFSLEQGKIKKIICFNEHVKKSFVITDLVEMEYLFSELDIPSNQKEFLEFEAYL
ncbi:hypothetical protein [Leptospira harrisiae]|uniref:Uncharacterized protein n=1 Tax=Leptospira harrisiae TaxID=2023189 RepID=A0A2N0APR3_9LEPT|nr:hypothetical protein [Leptospira harrisiae]PJZ86273.1 hypothetical protein CH364_08945 [Leptospira harrisiae]PKA09839.1 hypothetical protein CH366_09220 [Leptospira harrisiae]